MLLVAKCYFSSLLCPISNSKVPSFVFLKWYILYVFHVLLYITQGVVRFASPCILFLFAFYDINWGVVFSCGSYLFETDVSKSECSVQNCENTKIYVFLPINALLWASISPKHIFNAILAKP